MQKVVIFGTDKLGILAYEYFSKDSNLIPVAFTVDKEFITSDSIKGLPVIPFDNICNVYPPTNYRMFIAIGYTKLNNIRTQKYFEAKDKGYILISYIHQSSAIWDDVEVGENCLILENQVIQPNVKIGNNVIIWSGNHIGHDVIIGDHCYIASHTVLSGNVIIGKKSFIGINASIRDNINIGEQCIIGAGAVITHNVKSEEVYIVENTKKYLLTSSQFEKMMDISPKKNN